MIIVKVIFHLPIRQYFKYFMPAGVRPIIGGRVVVSFNSKDIVGIVVSFYETSNISQLNFKLVKSLIDTESLYTNIVLEILMWISKNYHCPIGNIFFSVLPKILRSTYTVKKNRDTYQWSITKKGQELADNQLKRKKSQLYTLLFLKKNNILSTELKKYNFSKAILRKLESQGLCKISVNHKIFTKNRYMFPNKKRFFLNQKILININDILIKKSFSSWLLTKVNLYTKVKFYLGLIESLLYNHKQILILVPYIKYINTIMIFLKKFFNIDIDIMHPELTNTQYFENWIRTKNGENSIVIGTSECVFLPFLQLGMIIIFEEHHLNYKSMNQCRYNSRDIGIFRAYKENIPIILNSDTPSLKTLHNILFKKCFYIKLSKYNLANRLNSIIVNVKKDRIKFGLSLNLVKEICNNFHKRQVLLIFNKCSLFLSVLMCNKCSWIFECHDCHNYFEINQYNVMWCKFCLIKIKKPILCYQCGLFSLKLLKISIEKIQNQIQNLFPEKRLFFLFSKSHITKSMFNEKIFCFSDPCIIFITDKIVQNYFFPYVRLISLISIDNYLLSFQFRSLEYFAQYYFNLTKLTKKITNSFKILIQTSLSNHSDLKEIHNNEYFFFAHKTLFVRKKFFLPPWSVQNIVYSESTYANNNIMFLDLIHQILQKKSKQYNIFLWFVGPQRSLFSQNQKKCLHQLLIQSHSRTILNSLFNQCIDIINFFSISKKVKWFLDVDPH